MMANGPISARAFSIMPQKTFRSRVLIFVALVMMVPLITYWLPWNYEKAGFPIKPRDFTLVFGALLMFLIGLNRPAFCLPAFLPIVFLAVRVFDAGVLERFTVTALGTHDVYVMVMLSNILVTLLLIMLPATDRGMDVTRWLATAIIVGCCAANVYEWMGYVKLTRFVGRIAGYVEDPNHSPILCCLLLGVLYTVNPNFWWNVAVSAVSAVGIALTLSRSGMAVFAGMFLIYVAMNFRRHVMGLIILVAVAIPCAGTGFTLLASSSRNGVVNNADVGTRLQAIYELDFEKIKSPERAKDLQDGWEAVGQAIILGHGTGAGANKWLPHNQFVAVWLDMGIFGLLAFGGGVFALAFVSLRERFRAFLCVMPVILFIPCSQVLVETPVYWFTIAVACYVLFPKRFVFRLSSRAEHPVSHSSGAAAARVS